MEVRCSEPNARRIAANPMPLPLAEIVPELLMPPEKVEMIKVAVLRRPEQ